MWVFPTQTASSQTIFSICNGAAANSFFDISQNTTAQFEANAQSGVSPSTAAAALTISANKWYYLVARFITGTNKTMSVLSYDGIVANGSNSTSDIPTSITRAAFGTRDISTRARFFDGIVSEFFITNVDIQGDGAALQTSTLGWLAFNGPFSIPHIAKNIVEYRSFRDGLDSTQDSLMDNYWGAFGRQTWVNNAAATVGISPPYLSSSYAKPQQKKRILVV
jgi:hypothetical protein